MHILIGSGPFDPEYAQQIMTTRLSRLNRKDKQKADFLMRKIQDGDVSDNTLKEFGEVLSKADLYNPNTEDRASVKVRMGIYQEVWPEADKLRKSGKLIELGKKIKCSVVIIHGDYDPHPFEGVQKPLVKVISGIKFILLERCGHTPWREKEASRAFYKILIKEL